MQMIDNNKIASFHMIKMANGINKISCTLLKWIDLFEQTN